MNTTAFQPDHLLRCPDDQVFTPHEVVSLTFRKGYSMVRAWREHLGLTQQQVAQRMGVAQQTYARFEAPGAAHRPSTLKRIADAMGLSWEQLEDPRSS